MSTAASILTHFERVKQQWMEPLLRLLDEAIAASSPEGTSLVPMASYHLGTGGKRLRALIPLLVADALEVDPARVLGFAAACEILHNATLVHDDLQDGDTLRRGQPTVWAKWGMPRAVNLGDAMLYWTFAALDRVDFDDSARYALSQRIVRDTLRVIDGQEREFLLQAAGEVSLDDYYRMVEGKTSGLFALPMAGTAQLCGAAPEVIAGLEEAAQHLGVLFQLQDDVLDLYGDKGREQAGSDLGEGKISALVAHALQHAPTADARWLRQVLQAPREELDAAQVTRAAVLFRRTGSLAAVLEEIARRQELATQQQAIRDHAALHAIVVGLGDLFVAPIAQVDGG